MQVKWIVKTERGHAIYARFEDAFQVVTHGVESIVGAAGELRWY